MAEMSTSSIPWTFLIEVRKLKLLKRTGWVMRRINYCETVAGHMYRMAIMAFLLDDKILNRDRCIKLALIHDLPECIVGDITPFCGVSKEVKHRREMDAMKRLCSSLGNEIGKELLSLYVEYEEQKTVEAKSVKDLDKFDMLLQAFEYELRDEIDLQDFFDKTGGVQNETVLNWFQELQCLRSKNLDGSFSSRLKKSKLKVFEFFRLIFELKHMKRNCSCSRTSSYADSVTVDQCKVEIKPCECETFADHMYETSIMVLLLDGGTCSGLNKEKCIKMALIRNITESSRTITDPIYLGKEKQDEVKVQIMQKVCGFIDEGVKKEFIDLFKEYKAQDTLEAKSIKDLVRLASLLQSFEHDIKFGTSQCEPRKFYPSFNNSEVSRWAKEVHLRRRALVNDSF